jgi:hypothetical protein
MSIHSKNIRITTHVKQLGALIDILSAIEKSGQADLIATIDIQHGQKMATIIGKNLDALSFQLATLGYEFKIGPMKTHCFITLEDL